MILFLELVLFAGVWAYIFLPYFLDDDNDPPAATMPRKQL